MKNTSVEFQNTGRACNCANPSCTCDNCNCGDSCGGEHCSCGCDCCR